MALSHCTHRVSVKEQDNSDQIGQKIPAECICERLHQFYDSIVKSLNASELNIVLVQEKLFTAQEVHQSLISAELLIKKVEDNGLGGYTTFYLCVSKEKNHLGHRYVQTMLENKVYASKEAIEHSMIMKGKLISNLPVLTSCNLKELLTHMYSKNLLTPQEWVKLNDQTYNERNELLIGIAVILDTKGPLAHGLFAECLQTVDCSLYAQIFKTEKNEPPKRQKRVLDQVVVIASPTKRAPPKMKLCGCLRSHRYNEIMAVFQQCHHNGEWIKLEAEVKKLMTPSTPKELQIVAHLESAISWVFRKDEKAVLDLVAKARDLLHDCDVDDDNATILDGRSEYILSRLYRYLQQWEKAEKHIVKATYLLQFVEPGEDTAFMHYCNASIQVETLGKNPTKQELRHAKWSYEYALEHARRHDSGLDLVAPHSFMRLAQMHLGSSHYCAGSQRDNESITKASNCLTAVDQASLSRRSKCHYLLIQSDFKRCRKDLIGSKLSARNALELAQACNFTTEVISAEQRIETL